MRSANFPMIHQPLLIECNATIVSGINSAIDIIWTIGNTQVRRVNYVKGSIINSSSVYDSFIIPSLNISQIGRVYQCEIWINSILLVIKENFIVPIPSMYNSNTFIVCYRYLTTYNYKPYCRVIEVLKRS